MSDRQRTRTDRPIDNYPRVRDGAWWVMSSGIVPAVCGLWFVSRAWLGMRPGLSALMAFFLGMSSMAQFTLRHE